MKIQLREHRVRFQHLLDRLPIQTRLIIAYLLILLLPTVLFSSYFFNEFYASRIQAIIQENRTFMEIEKINIRNNMESMERTAQLVLSDRDTQEYLNANREWTAEQLIQMDEEIVPNLLRLQYNNPDIDHIRMYTSNPYVYEIWPLFLHENRVTNAAWYRELQKREGIQYWVFANKAVDLITGKSGEVGPKISLYRDILSSTGMKAGAVQVDMTLEHFFPKSFSGVAGNPSQTVILDRFGEAYTQSGNRFLSEAGVETKKLLRTYANNRSTEIGSRHFMDGDVPYLIVYTYLDTLEANMIGVVSLEDVFTDIYDTRNNIILVMLIMVAVLSVTTYFFNSLILKKLRILTESMKKIHRGDFNLDITIKGSGEIGELAFHFRKMLKRINTFLVEEVNKKAATKEAELKTLRSQIDSHFLYNTLENIKMMAEIEGQYSVSDALTSLGGMMRYNLSWSSEYVRLKDELDHITNYVAIMNVRFDNAIELIMEIEPAYYEQEMLKMSMQPLVENAVKHGVPLHRLDREGLRITIRAAASPEGMVIEITDNGAGIQPAALAALNERIATEEPEPSEPRGGSLTEGSGIGLRNVNQRIRIFYGKDYGIVVLSETGQSTTVRMTVPLLLLSGGLQDDA
ncbi:hypothetical protein SY83_03635 [Paenibacillus swuensis]|uniref:histidine kinase n=1 Tax=Paenibacillus swuensis TaxID=1178515 RepID=A0A172TEV9_9BACL|nr:sensor histidine kinase [Paenibacillus swuensis]ANE45550.1 hypothetical protein SY83_03635 [Paenibacillus swuensis]